MSLTAGVYFIGFGTCYFIQGMLYKLKGEQNEKKGAVQAKLLYSLFSWFGVTQVLKEFDLECDKQDKDHTHN